MLFFFFLFSLFSFLCKKGMVKNGRALFACFFRTAAVGRGRERAAGRLPPPAFPPGYACPEAGKDRWKTVPAPRVLSAEISPPWR